MLPDFLLLSSNITVTSVEHYLIKEYKDDFDIIIIKLLAFHMLTKGLDVISKQQYALAA